MRAARAGGGGGAGEVGAEGWRARRGGRACGRGTAARGRRLGRGGAGLGEGPRKALWVWREGWGRAGDGEVVGRNWVKVCC